MASETEIPDSAPGEPFAERPAELPSGCGKPVLVGCAVAVVVAGGLLLVLLLKVGDWMPRVFRWSLEGLEAQVEANLPPEVGPAERRRMRAAFDAAADAVDEGRADPAALHRLQGLLLDVTLGGGRLDREQLDELIEALEEVAGERAPPDVPPADAPQPAIA